MNEHDVIYNLASLLLFCLFAHLKCVCCVCRIGHLWSHVPQRTTVTVTSPTAPCLTTAAHPAWLQTIGDPPTVSTGKPLWIVAGTLHDWGTDGCPITFSSNNDTYPMPFTERTIRCQINYVNAKFNPVTSTRYRVTDMPEVT